MTASSKRQSWNPKTYDTHARFVSDLAAGVLEWLAVKPGERVLDLGCGDGVLTERLAGLGADVTGVDTSAELLESASRRGLDVHLMDGHALQFDNEFDAVFSNAALHWMTEPEKVVTGVFRALKPNGRFVGEFGGHGNVAAIITAMRAAGKANGGDISLAGPWFFPTPEYYGQILEKKGFKVRRIELIPRPTQLKTGMKEWLKLFRQPFFDQFGHNAGEILGQVEALLKPSLCDSSGNWTADYVRLRFEAVRKA